jgi:hypothetical protein
MKRVKNMFEVREKYALILESAEPTTLIEISIEI